jgi:glutamate synthase (NADPH) small chain
VTIEQIEKEIIERAFAEGWVRPQPPASAPASTWRSSAAARPAGRRRPAQPRRAPGHRVRGDDRIGGLLRYGIPDFKMEKWVIDRRLERHGAPRGSSFDRRRRRRHPAGASSS